MKFSINLYGLALTLSFLLGLLFLKWNKPRRFSFSATDLEDLILVTVPLAVVGARFYHIFTTWGYYADHLQEIFFVWQGGLGIFGALAGGVLGAIIFAKLKNLDAIKVLDWLVVPLPLMQAVGRLGNVFNRELLPFAYYEIILDLAVFGLLLTRYHDTIHGSGKRIAKGTTAVYLVAYGLGRFMLEFIRIDRLDTLNLSGLGFNQVMSLGVAGLGIFLWMKIVRS